MPPRCSTFWQSGRGFAPKSLPAPLDLKGKIPPQEWSVLVRAVDLVNRGYFLEGFVVGFALLDAKLQEFIEANIPKARLRKIEGDRLVTFVGPLTKSILFASPLDDPAVSDDLAWLNRTRNEIMHAGRTCNRDEALRGLRVVLELLRFYRDKGSHYILPEQLDFPCLDPVDDHRSDGSSIHLPFCRTSTWSFERREIPFHAPRWAASLSTRHTSSDTLSACLSGPPETRDGRWKYGLRPDRR